jgi:hypothetical protein
MASLWPWLAVAGVGALHGLNPATGWMLGRRLGRAFSGDRAQALRALLPIAVGHAASVALVAGAVMFGLSMDRVRCRWRPAGCWSAVAVLTCRAARPRRRARRRGTPAWRSGPS